MTEFTYRDIEAERAVLGSALIDQKAAELVAEMDTEAFNEPMHRVIHSSIKRLIKAGKPVDLVTMHATLEENKQSQLTGGPAYLMDLLKNTLSSANVRHHIAIVRECYTRRQLRNIGKALAEASADDSRSLEEIREQAIETIRDVKSGEITDLVPLEQSIINTFEKLGQMQKQDGKDSGRVPTGLSGLDKCLGGGLLGSMLMIIGARPSVGKSALALTFCLNAARNKKKVLLLSLEMDREEIDERIMSNESLVSLSEITSGEISEESWKAMASVLPHISSLPITYSTEADTVEDLRRAAVTMIEKDGLDLICVDYLQLMRGSKSRYGNRQEEVADISRGLKRLARELQIPIIALSQLSRYEKTAGRKRVPTMSDARESGAIEQDANVFILLHEPEMDEVKSDTEKMMIQNMKKKGYVPILVNIDKNRQGRKAFFYIAFDGQHMRFLPIAKDN